MLTVKNGRGDRLLPRSVRCRRAGARHSVDRQVVAELAIDGLRFFVVDEKPEAFNLSPKSLDGTTVRINLIADDPDAVAAQAVRAGARELFPVADQPYGLRQGRSPTPRVTTG